MANIIPALTNDTLGTPNKPWKSVVASRINLSSVNPVTSTSNALYIQNGALYFNGNPVGQGSVISNPWKAYEIILAQETQSTCEVWVSGANMTHPEDILYPVQARVLYNGIEILPSNLTFEVGTYGDLFNIEPGSMTEIDPSEQGTKITINIPNEGGQAFVFDAGSSILVWSNE